MWQGSAERSEAGVEAELPPERDSPAAQAGSEPQVSHEIDATIHSHPDGLPALLVGEEMATPLRAGTTSSKPSCSTSESDANLLPRIWSCLVRSDEATQAVSPHSRVVQLPPSYSAARHQRRLAAKAKPSMPEPSNAKLAGSGTAPTTLGFFYRLRQLEGRTRQQPPAAVLLQPDLQDADLGVGNFAVEFAFRHPQMTHYSVVANDRDCEVWKIKRLEDSLSRHDRVDEFCLVFEPRIRVAVAQLLGCERFELRLVLCEHRLAQRLDRLFDCLLIVGSGHCRQDQGCCAEREHARGSQITTCQVHEYPPIVIARLIRAARPSHPSA